MVGCIGDGAHIYRGLFGGGGNRGCTFAGAVGGFNQAIGRGLHFTGRT